jgi:malonyl CoA-acyl carrier protein transacylase
MSLELELPLIAFLWRCTDIASSIVTAARRTGTRALFDISGYPWDQAGRALLQADAEKDAVEIKVAASQIFDLGLEEFVTETDISRVWVELHPALLNGDSERFLERIAELSSQVTVIPVVGDMGLISRILEAYPAIRHLALKGSEASGFVSTETTFTLYGSVRELISSAAEPPDLLIWGGIATPEAAAAFLAAGAKGIVFESIHWLTDLVGLEPERSQRIANLRPDHTDLVGLNLQVPCRFFNKGNSKAVKDLKAFAGSVCGGEITEERRTSFADRIASQAVEPLSGSFGKDELIPLGVEATFASSFVRRFGDDTEGAIGRFIEAMEDSAAAAKEKVQAFQDSPTAAAMGTRYPFVQGAMSWITDVPEFARKVADAGGMPTLALGMMDKETLDQKLGRLSQIMGDKPYAVNVIALAENPHRDVQLAWIRRQQPRFAVIAAGEPSVAKELLHAGVEPIYIAPNADLLKLALAAGVRYVICEGHEAGGHVGQHSTLTLAQMVLDLRDREPARFEGCRIILAGGVFNRETAFIAAMLGADAVQVGTAYLATREIVEAGALKELYRRMIVESSPGGTVVTGEGTGLRVRSLRTPRIEAVCTLEREFSAGSEDEASFRRKIEALSAGSLFVAARGMDRPGGTELDEAACREQGQFMSGACAGAVHTVRSVEELHHELASGPLATGLPFTGPIVEAPLQRGRPAIAEPVPSFRKSPAVGAVVRPTAGMERIAITGMSVVNSLANSPEEVWEACLAGKSGIVPVPPSRWNHELFFHPRPRTPERTYCRVGAFQHIELTRKDIGIPPQDFRTMTDSTKLTMWLAGNALHQSGLLESDIPRERIAVLISQNSGEAAVTLQDVIIRGSLNTIVSAVKRAVALTPELEAAVAEEIAAGRIAIDDTTLLGRLNCSAGGFICNKYGFMGPSFSVSAACATALVALYSAYQMVRNGIIDAAVVGGAEEFLTPMHFLEFSALGALAGLTGVERPAPEMSRPFDADRDGMVLGEGGGVIVIERESVARRRGAVAHAYITSMGASNNHLGMVESSRITQEIAINASFADSSYGPEGVDLVECHATSTRQGDVEEVQALKKFFSPDKRTVLTSFKSQIGHTLGASGVNSLIRGVMAMKAGIFPATLNYMTPDPDVGLEGSGMVVPAVPTEWDGKSGSPRRLQVNAFGFGGSNYVVQVEQALEHKDVVLVSPAKPGDLPVEPARDALLPGGLWFFRTEIGGDAFRMAAVASTEEEAVALVEKAEPFTNGSIPAKRLRALAKQGIHLGNQQSTPPPLAFVFPGQGSHYAGMSHELYQTFPVIREWMDRAAAVAEFDLLQLMFYDKEEDLQKTRWQQPALFTMEFAMVQYLLSLGIKPTAMAGHSLGELTALCVAGVYSFEDGFRIVNKRAICMDKACTQNVDPGIMMAVDAPMDLLEEKLRHVEHVYITNINSPHQVVLGGDTAAVTALGEELKSLGHRRTRLRVSMAFHSPIMRCIHDELEEFIAGITFHAPRIPVVSNTTTVAFPSDTDEIRRIVMAHLESPVHWMQNARTLWNDYGIRLFVEVGPRDILSNLCSDSIEDADCIQTCLPSAEALMYRTALAQLYARGHLRVKHRPKFVAFPGSCRTSEPARTAAVVSAPMPVAVQPQARSLENLVQREINSFVMESFGRFLMPGLLHAIRREYDPHFSEESLKGLLGGMFPSAPVSTIVIPSVTTPPVLGQPVVAAEPVSAPRIETPPAEPGATSEADSITEAVIRIIMDATGWERDEIEPGMNIREDLEIRSSRLPVIMDALEAHFGIKIELEQFMDVRTVQDIADRIADLVGKTGKLPAAVSTSAPSPAEGPAPAMERKSLKRVIFRDAPVDAGSIQPVELKPLESVVILSAAGGTGLRKQVGTVFRRDYGVDIVPMAFLHHGAGEEDGAFDLRDARQVAEAAESLARTQSLAGVVFLIEHGMEERVQNVQEISQILKGFFKLLQTYMESTSKKFALCLHHGDENGRFGGLLAEGMVGMFLSAAHEFGSVQFRTVRVDSSTHLRDAIRAALDRSQKALETMYRDGSLYTRQGLVAPSASCAAERLRLSSDDVVVFSGGAYGITPALAKSLAPFGCKMVFLGRTELDPDSGAQPGKGQDRTSVDSAKALKASEVAQNLRDLQALGIDASYYSCDVTDGERLDEVTKEITNRHGKITGVVHSAGILRDNFLKNMTADDFSAVVDVKFLGAWNLFQAVDKAGLRFMVCLSSAACIQGNPGQVNYAAGNRMMSALVSLLSEQNDSILFKALMLPPIEGAGMAEDQDIRDLMKRMNADYVHAAELAELFCRELFVAPAEDVWTLFMRSLPDVSIMRLDQSDVPVSPGHLQAAAMTFRREDFPMIDTVSRIDLTAGELEAERVFSHERDLWLNDHKPFKFLRHPLVSAIMAVETFLEASRILYPYLHVRGIRNAQFLEIIEVPEGVQRQAAIQCKTTQRSGRDVLCDLALACRDLSRPGRPIEWKFPNYTATVILQGGDQAPLEAPQGFPVTREELDSRPMEHPEVLTWYENRTDLVGRYRVIDRLDGTAPDAICGTITYAGIPDFAGRTENRYQYSPYLLESLLQMVNFYIVMKDPAETRAMIPTGIAEMTFFSKCTRGSKVTLEGRLRNQTDEGLTWDVRALDEKGRILMLAKNLAMRWFSK